jgi:hypothetical protein
VTEHEPTELVVEELDLESVLDRLAYLSRRYDVAISLTISPYASTDATGNDDDRDDDRDTAG